jgi:Uma2 family endonuclease
MSIEPQLHEEYTTFLEEDMPESQPQINLSDYLRAILKHLYRIEKWFNTGNLAIYPPTHNYPFTYMAPDVALFKGIVLSDAEQADLTSWRMSEPNRPAPTVVFEISSKETWPLDLNPKPSHYQLLGVQEYFAYDPQRYWQGATTQLRGWRYIDNNIQELQPDTQGRLWSSELNSYLAPDGPTLRLYEPDGTLRLTVEEAERAAKEAALRREQILLEKLRKANIDPDSL